MKSLRVRQKQPLSAKGTGGIGDLMISPVDVWGLVCWRGEGILIARLPQFPL